MTIDDLTVNFRHLDRETLLEEWGWLIGPTRHPIILTALGNAFVQDVEDDAILFVDTGKGELYDVADTPAELMERLKEKDFVVDHFDVQMVGDLRLAGKVLEHDQIYSFIVPLFLGGEYVIENVEQSSLEVHFSLSGQLCRQIQDLPPGTSVGAITIE